MQQSLEIFPLNHGRRSWTREKTWFHSTGDGREINTTGSKSNHAEMQNIVVQMKDELEQIKEQVLNEM